MDYKLVNNFIIIFNNVAISPTTTTKIFMSIYLNMYLKENIKLKFSQMTKETEIRK